MMPYPLWHYFKQLFHFTNNVKTYGIVELLTCVPKSGFSKHYMLII